MRENISIYMKMGKVFPKTWVQSKRCKEAVCQNKISYKFLTGDVVDEIVNEVKGGNYNLVLLKSNSIDSWMKSLFSDTRKISGSITIPYFNSSIVT